MTQPNYETREIWTTGRQQCSINVSVIIYPNTIVATADADHITQHQMRQTLSREFPQHSFIFNNQGGRYTIRADAGRWPFDGV